MISDGEITARIMQKVEKTAAGCWIWLESLTGSGGANLNMSAHGVQHSITVHRYLWQREHGYPPPVPQQPCAQDRRCVRPAHRPLRYDLRALVAAVDAVRCGTTPHAAARQHGLPRETVVAMLTPADWDAYHQSAAAAADAVFMQHTERRGEHLIWRRRTCNVQHAGHQLQAKQKAWLLSGRELPPDVILWRTCAEADCIEPAHQRAVKARAARLPKQRRSNAVRRRNLQMVELVMHYHWTNLQVATLFGCSRTLVQHVIAQAGLGRRRTRTIKACLRPPRVRPVIEGRLSERPRWTVVIDMAALADEVQTPLVFREGSR